MQLVGGWAGGGIKSGGLVGLMNPGDDLGKLLGVHAGVFGDAVSQIYIEGGNIGKVKFGFGVGNVAWWGVLRQSVGHRCFYGTTDLIAPAGFT